MTAVDSLRFLSTSEEVRSFREEVDLRTSWERPGDGSVTVEVISADSPAEEVVIVLKHKDESVAAVNLATLIHLASAPTA